jgi:hypothetical protein
MQEGDETERGEERKGEGDRRDLREGKTEREKNPVADRAGGGREQ